MKEMKEMKTLSKLFVLLLVCCGSVFAQYGDALLAIVGNEVITLYNVQRMTASEEKRLARQFKDKELENRILELRTAALNTLIERELFAMEFKALGAKVPQALVQDRINRAIVDHAGGSQARLEDMLQKEGMTLREYRERLEKDISVELLVRDRVSRGNLVSEQAIDERYAKDREKMATGAKWHIAVILLKKNGKYADTDATFKKIMAELAEGKPFAELAGKYSESPDAAKGGDQGWMDNMHPSLMATVKTLKPGQTASKLTDIGSGRYVVRLIDEKKGGIPELDEELRGKIRIMLQKEEENRRYEAYVKELYMKYPVRRMDGANTEEN